MQKTSAEVDMNKRQKYLGQKGLIALITFLSAFIPLSTDLYLPALPGMAVYFKAPINLVNLTLILFFIFFSAGMLFWGPLSDKYGRKPVLLTGLTVYILASLFSACVVNVYQLIIFRVFQAIGGGAAASVAMAMVKDTYDGKKRESILALVQSMTMICPITAPVLGAILLKFISWRGIFWTLTGIGILALAGALALEETIGKRYTGTIGQTMGRLGVVLKNPGFSSLLSVFALAGIPTFAYLASSSYIYIDGFGLSEQTYSYFFALNAVFLLLSPMLYLILSRRFNRGSIIITCFAVVAMSGALIGSLGNLGPWLFAVTLIPSTIASNCVRPPGTNLMLEQQQEDTGSASALMSCVSLLMGSVGMLLISYDWSNIILALGILNLIVGLTCGVLWLLISKRSFIKQVPQMQLLQQHQAKHKTTIADQ
ncbi:Bicyclomycin resistance protein [Pelotomaculum schinkii]|uniref:Bcr/CflA family efflux transporter n=1 Tax=Pelotomaculum schinkii TaxID=78350 RepID=A0A4Y7RBK8_9FIRM|nr:Bcr/CflA family efflux MFS transporter [Pelotomaculum schinkii]TEB06100.1 Bicyclomycin resistance protein [Pelotomaculum schinkii]